MGVVHLAADRIADRSEWIPFEEFGVITEKVADEHPTFLGQTQEQWRKERGRNDYCHRN
jgi:hypothetical protein